MFFLHPFSLLAAIHLFISSHDEIKDFYLTRKKTGRRYVRRKKIIHANMLYMCIYPYLMRRNMMRRYKQRHHIQQ